MQDAAYTGAVNGGCLLAMPTIAAQEYADVMDSLLYMQLAANKQHSPYAEACKWHEVFSNGLASFGWVLINNNRRQQTLDAPFTLAQLAAANWDMPQTAEQHAALQALWDAMAKAPVGDRALGVLRSNVVGSVEPEECKPREGWKKPAWFPSLRKPAAPAAQSSAPVAPPVPCTAITLQAGLLLPERRVQLLFLHFCTQQAPEPNVFAQQFAASQLLSRVQLKSYMGELSESRYGAFRERFAGMLADHRPRQWVEHLPLQEASHD